jgi:L-threonylcarbamoyladenylate synthase
MLSDAISVLQSWGTIAIPTETVYGLAVDATNGSAVHNLFAIKKRPKDKAITIQVWHINDISTYAHIDHLREQRIIENFMPWPVTLVLRKKDTISSAVTAWSAFVGVRISSHPITLALLQSIDFPLAVPSANISWETPAKTVEEAEKIFGKDVSAYISNDGYSMSDVASTVVQVIDWKVVILREGAIGLEDIQKFCI